MPAPFIGYNDASQSWEASLPIGYRFVSGPHSLVEQATATGRQAPAKWKTAAKQILLDRLAVDSVVYCDCEECQLTAEDILTWEE